MSRSILFVDDEPGILHSFGRLFDETDYDVHVAGSGEEALDVLRSNPVDLVISDMRIYITKPPHPGRYRRYTTWSDCCAMWGEWSC